MGLLSDLKKGARKARDEADTQMQLARKYTEQVNLQRARKDALSEVGAEVLDVSGDVERQEVRLTPRARALLEEARRIDQDLQNVRRDIDRLKRGSSLLGEGERHGGPVPANVENPETSAAATPTDVKPEGHIPEGAGGVETEEKARAEEQKGA